jgi:phosphatidate cytidylyltransferase
MVCVYGLSHAPALLLLEFRGLRGRGAFLVFFLVMVAPRRRSRRRPGQPLAAPAPGGAAHRPLASRSAPGAGRAGRGFVGAALYWITPFKAGQALAMAFIAGGAARWANS